MSASEFILNPGGPGPVYSSGFQHLQLFGKKLDKKKENIMDEADIGWAVKQLQNGKKVEREGWNGKGQYLKLQVPDVNSKMSLPYVYIVTVQGKLVPWLASQTDLLAIDWKIVE